MRSRDIKHKLDVAYMGNNSGTPEQRAEARQIEGQLRAMARIRKKQARHQLRSILEPDKPLPTPIGGLKRGPKPNPFLDKCEHGVLAKLTKREHDAFLKLWKRKAPKLTRSTFLRSLICEALEAERRKDCPSQSFIVDLANVHDDRRTARERAQRAA